MDEEDNLELLLVKVTNPLVQPNIEALQAVCQQLCKEHDGPQISLRFLAHKIQSPQEREAMLALFVLEEMVKRCNTRFHNEIGKFRFLNELIKVVSPKYMGNKASPNVKKKIIELMFKWSIELKQEAKILEAYKMLKRQGVVTEDPVNVLENYRPPTPPPPRPKNEIFEDEEKSKMLQRLLHSRNQSDLLAANQLIKSMVQEADKRMEQIARRASELETVHNNANVLTDMLNNYKPGETSEEEKDLMKELYESCERLRPKIFKLAGEVDEKEEGFNDLLKANDELTSVISKYKQIIGVNDTSNVNGFKGSDELTLMDLNSPLQEVSETHGDSSLLDEELLSLGLNDCASGVGTSKSESANSNKLTNDHLDLRQIFSSASMSDNPCMTYPNGISYLKNTSEENSQSSATIPLFSVPTNTAALSVLPTSKNTVLNNQMIETKPFGTILPQNYSTANTSSTSSVVLSSQKTEDPLVSLSKVKQNSSYTSKALEDLDVLGQSLLKQSLPPNVPLKAEFPSTPQKVPMNKLQKVEGKTETSLPNSPVLPRLALSTNNQEPCNSTTTQISKDSPNNSPLHDPLSLRDIVVPLESIKPATLPSLTLHEKNGVTVIIHFGKDKPRPDVSVLVVTTLSQNPNPVKSFSFHAAVPKTMKIKLQPPSATDLPSFNPILPPAAITQVMLVGNPNQGKVRLKYRITYTIKDERHTDINEVDSLFEPRR